MDGSGEESKNQRKRRFVGEDLLLSTSASKRKKSDEDDSEVVSEEESSFSKEERRKGKFKNFPISKASRKILKSRGITHLFPIQYLTYNHVYNGKDVIAQARTGTGKTLSFVIPLVERMLHCDERRTERGRPPVVLAMAPTRELANQVKADFVMLAQELSVFSVYGGVQYEFQEVAFERGLDILVGTPGRILDHMHRGNLDLSALKFAGLCCVALLEGTVSPNEWSVFMAGRYVVLDEADRMLEVGFAESVEEILSASFSKDTGKKPQLLLFSATIPFWVKDTARRYMAEDREWIDLIGQDTLRTAVLVEHKAICCPYSERSATLCDVIQVYSGSHGRTMVFCSTKAEANELALNSVLKQESQVLHGDIPQKQREITLRGFREGKFPVLVATDVASRGLDIPEVDLVIQCEPPKDVDAYIHRSGRTGRAGRTGTCVMFYKLQQEYLIRVVERKAGIRFQRIGAPQAGDIVRAAGEDAVRCLENVPQSVLPHFQVSACRLIEEKGAENALAAALAYISGFTEIKSRSLLSSQQGYVTYLMQYDREVRSNGFFWKIIEQKFGEDVKQSIRGMRMCSDSKGVVFDMPVKYLETIKEKWSDGRGLSLDTPQTLPDLKERLDSRYSQQRGTSYQPSFERRNGHLGNGGSWQQKSFGRGSTNGGSYFRSSLKQTY